MERRHARPRWRRRQRLLRVVGPWRGRFCGSSLGYCSCSWDWPLSSRRLHPDPGWLWSAWSFSACGCSCATGCAPGPGPSPRAGSGEWHAGSSVWVIGMPRSRGGGDAYFTRRSTSDVMSRAADRRRTGDGLASPLGLAHHQGRHQLRRAPATSDVEAAAAARIPTQKEEFRLQQETVFFLSSEHGPLRGS
jgi:hypothetical protein